MRTKVGSINLLQLTVEHHNFLIRMRKPDESVEELKNFSLTCDLTTLRESLIRDMFIVGLNKNNYQIKERLLPEDDFNLDKSIKIANLIEVRQVHAQHFVKNNEASVNNIKSKS